MIAETGSVKETELTGWISDYWEQGMEGLFYRVFQDEKFAESRFAGWQPEGMHILGEGHHLTIFDEEQKILWSGTIKTRRYGLLNLCKLYPSNPLWTPENVSLEDWNKWFRHQPPLEAALRSCLET